MLDASANDDDDGVDLDALRRRVHDLHRMLDASANDDDDGIDLDALRRRVRDLHRMLDASANCLAHAEGSGVDGG